MRQNELNGIEIYRYVYTCIVKIQLYEFIFLIQIQIHWGIIHVSRSN